jgi:hypothetical protein
MIFLSSAGQLRAMAVAAVWSVAPVLHQHFIKESSI